MTEYTLCEIKRRKKKFAANAAGYMIAVFCFVLLGDILILSKIATGGILSNTGTHFIAYTPLCGSESCNYKLKYDDNEGFIVNNIKTKLLYKGLLARIQNLSSVQDASPFILYKIKNISGADYIYLGGFDPSNKISVSSTSCSAMDIVQGKFLSETDQDSVILEESYAVSNKILVGNTIVISGKKFMIKGIISPGIRPAKADIYFNYPALEKIISERVINKEIENHMNIILVEAKNSTLHKKAMEDVKSILGENGLLSSYKCYEPAAQVIGINNNGIFVLMIIICMAVFLYSIKTQYSAVLERRFDIGILISIGWNKKNIGSLFLIESVFTSTAGGIAGLITAFIATMLIPLHVYFKQAVNSNIYIIPALMAASLIFSVSAGVLTGLISALKAVNLKPAECLRKL